MRPQSAGRYNPYTGDDVAARQWYNARTGQSGLFAGSYNSMTGDGSYVGESAPDGANKLEVPKAELVTPENPVASARSCLRGMKTTTQRCKRS
jgi:hypothetical protein